MLITVVEMTLRIKPIRQRNEFTLKILQAAHRKDAHYKGQLSSSFDGNFTVSSAGMNAQIDGHRSEPWCLCEKVLKEKPEYTLDKFLALLEGRSDEKSESMKRRLASCYDLPAVDARYHVKCKSKLNLLSLSSPPVFKQSGRPQNKRQADNFDRLCSWMEKEGELYTVQELFNQMITLSDDPSDPDGQYCRPFYLKQELKKRYGENIMITEKPGRSDIVCLKTSAATILKDAWYANRMADADNEAKRIVETASELILHELRSATFDSSVYPTNDIIKDVEANKEWVPSLLRTLLEKLITSDLKQASIGQSIVHAVRPRSTVPPILFGLAVELDHMFGSRFLLARLTQWPWNEFKSLGGYQIQAKRCFKRRC